MLRSDVCIVGAGAAGITAALELARVGHGVILLEAGGVRRERSAEDALRGKAEGPEASEPRLDTRSVHRPLDAVRQRRLGGTTGSRGGRCVPLDEIDFEIRDYLPHSGWPIGREDLTPYYAWAARYCEIGEAEFTKETALPSSPPFLLRHGMAARFTDTKLLRYSRPTGFGARYRERLESSRSLRTFLHANVIKLEMDTDNRIASAVVATSPGVQFRVDARFYLLACGGLETTRLLLVSDLPATRSDGSVGALGLYYMTHLDGFVGAVKFDRPVPTPVFRYDRSPDGVYCRRLACLTEETMGTERLLNFSSVFHMPPPGDPAHRDGLLSAYAITKHALARSRIGFKSRRAGPRGT